MLSQVEAKERETADIMYCPVCKKRTKHMPAFFDTWYCTVCKVIRVPMRK